jgi:hypothetical protein
MRRGNTWKRVRAAASVPPDASPRGDGKQWLDDDRQTQRRPRHSMDYSELQARFDSVVSMVGARISDLGWDPASVLVVSREQLKVTAVAVENGPSAPYTMYLSTAMDVGPLDRVAEQFIAGWLNRRTSS